MNNFYVKMKGFFLTNSFTATATDISHVLVLDTSDSTVHDGTSLIFIRYIKLLMMGSVNYKLQHNVTFDQKGL